MSPDRRLSVVIVGAGLTGLTAAYVLQRSGYDVTVYEREFVVGGHTRSEVMHGVPYEPHGPHVFHTDDREVWELVTSLVKMLPYRHRVQTEVRGEFFAWPLQIDELPRLDEWSVIDKELAALDGEVDASSFEAWCVSQMGETLYGLFIDGYTSKQWGRPGSALSASIGPKRVELRDDGYLDLFRDPYQGWPAGGYGALAEALAANVHISFGVDLTCDRLAEVVPPGVPVIVTAALDGFFGELYGPLEWRGVRMVAQWLWDVVGYAQPAMQVNRPSLDVPFTRTVESKHALGEDGAFLPGTVVLAEYPGAPAKHYPVPDARGVNRERQERYELELRAYARNPLFAAGRLARYTYINMDVAMREGLAVAARVDS